jgi:hypothetical protein
MTRLSNRAERQPVEVTGLSQASVLSIVAIAVTSTVSQRAARPLPAVTRWAYRSILALASQGQLSVVAVVLSWRVRLTGAATPWAVTVPTAAQVARAVPDVAGRAPNLMILERTVNGQPGLVAQQDGATVTVFAFDVAGDRIKHIWAVRNPEKLRPWTTG